MTALSVVVNVFRTFIIDDPNQFVNFNLTSNGDKEKEGGRESDIQQNAFPSSP